MTAIATLPEVFTYVPNNLDLAELMPKKWRDYARWFIGGLYLRQHTEKHLKREEYRPLSSMAIKAVLPKRDYKTILDILAKARVIECDNSYQNGEGKCPGYAKGYRLTPDFREAPYQRVQLGHSRLVSKVVKLWQREAKRLAPVHRHLKKIWLG